MRCHSNCFNCKHDDCINDRAETKTERHIRKSIIDIACINTKNNNKNKKYYNNTKNNKNI